MERGATSSIGRQPPSEKPPKTDGRTSPTFHSVMQPLSEDPELGREFDLDGSAAVSSDFVIESAAVSSDFVIETLREMTSNSSTIFRAPKYMRDCDSKAYEPTVLGIGLFNFHKGRRLSSRLHEHKSDCVSFLLARHGSNERAAELLEQCKDLVLKLEPDARSFYVVDDRNAVGRDKFTEMLLQDGCFILRLLLTRKKGKRQEVDDTSELKRLERELTGAPMTGALWIWNLVVYDLLKLENQIPFFVLQRLFDLLKTPADEDIDLVELALELFSGIYPARAKTFKPPPSSDVLHLLHLFHSSLIPPKLESTTVRESPDWIPSATLLQNAGIKDWIPSATVLQNAGIKVRPPNKKTVESFLEVTFENGVMEIPPVQVDDFTSLVFRNLIAFEQCYPNTRTHITIYARFMDCLLNTGRDVRLLSLDGVLVNRLGTEEAAADLFNKLCDQVHYTSKENYLCNVFTHVTEYYEKPWHKWRAALFQNYFSNPWVIISVLAAGVLLLLTIEQAAFAALSYFRPPE